MRIIFYSKPGCHLCEGLQAKLEQLTNLQFELEMRDITTRDDWFQQYQYEIPVLFLESGQGATVPIPRPSPRATPTQLEQMLQKFLTSDRPQ